MTKYILFDAGNTLADYDLDRLSRMVTAANGWDRAVLKERFSEHPLQRAVEDGSVSDAEYLEGINTELGLNWKLDDLIAAWQEIFSLNENGYRLFRELSAEGVRVCICSNIAHHHTVALKRNWPAFFDPSHQNFLSFEMGCAKPHSVFYETVLEKLAVPGAQTFFIDDRADNVKAARRTGIRATVYRPGHFDEVELAVRSFLA